MIKRLRKCFPRLDCPGMTFWCTDCRMFHTHGTGEGPRAPHCTEFRGQYWVEMHSINDLKRIKKGIDRYLSLTPDERKRWKDGGSFISGLKKGIVKGLGDGD